MILKSGKYYSLLIYLTFKNEQVGIIKVKEKGVQNQL